MWATYLKCNNSSHIYTLICSLVKFMSLLHEFLAQGVGNRFAAGVTNTSAALITILRSQKTTRHYYYSYFYIAYSRFWYLLPKFFTGGWKCNPVFFVGGGGGRLTKNLYLWLRRHVENTKCSHATKQTSQFSMINMDYASEQDYWIVNFVDFPPFFLKTTTLVHIPRWVFCPVTVSTFIKME